MTLSLALCIAAIAVAFVCTCYGIISILKIHKQEKVAAKKERIEKHLYISTSWLMWTDLNGIKVSNITSVEESKQGFGVLFAKKSSGVINCLLECSGMYNILEGHFEKLDNGRYQFINSSLDEAQRDIEKLLYCSLSAETGGT